jgi:hypothetical protein
MICDTCGVIVAAAMLMGNKKLCEECYIKAKPPMLILTKHWTNNALFDPSKKSYIGRDIKFLEGCGFKLFNHRIFSNNIVSPVYKEYITLRYYGMLTCSMIPEFMWPKNRQYCRDFNCYHK